MKKIFLTLNLVLFVIPFGISQGLPSYVPTDGLVAFYGFNGNVIDLTQNGYDGLIHNGQNGTINFSIDRKGISNSAINFNSNPEWNYLGPFVEFQQTSNLCVDSDFSINFFLNLSSNNIRGDVINKGPDYLNGNLLSRVYDNNTLKNGVSQVDYLFTQSDYLEGWKMITITNVGGLWSIYINGDLSSSGNIGNISNNDSPYFLGAMPSGGSNGSHWPLQGSVDDLGFWNRALTEQEIQNLYTSSTGDIILNGSVSAENNQIKNVADPTDAQDAVTKTFIENFIKNSVSMEFFEWNISKVNADNQTIQLSSKPFVFVNAANTTIILPDESQVSEMDVIYIYSLRGTNNAPIEDCAITFSSNSHPISSYKLGDGLITASVGQKIYGRFPSSGLKTIVFIDGQWFIGNFSPYSILD